MASPYGENTTNPWEKMDWFDPKDPSHVAAYRHLEKHGYWPDGWPLGPLPTLWQHILISRLADCWVEHLMTDNGYLY